MLKSRICRLERINWMRGINLITKYRKYGRQRWPAIILKSFSHIFLQEFKNWNCKHCQSDPCSSTFQFSTQYGSNLKKGLVQFHFLHIFVLASSKYENSIQICGNPDMAVTKWKILIILLMTCLSGYLYITYFDMIIQP